MRKADADPAGRCSEYSSLMKPRIRKIGNKWSCASKSACRCADSPREAYERWVAAVWWYSFNRSFDFRLDWRLA